MAEPDETTRPALPDDTADAWAVVSIDVYEEQQQHPTAANHARRPTNDLRRPRPQHAWRRHEPAYRPREGAVRRHTTGPTEQIAASLDDTISRIEYGLNYAKRLLIVQEVKGKWIAG